MCLDLIRDSFIITGDPHINGCCLWKTESQPFIGFYLWMPLCGTVCDNPAVLCLTLCSLPPFLCSWSYGHLLVFCFFSYPSSSCSSSSFYHCSYNFCYYHRGNNNQHTSCADHHQAYWWEFVGYILFYCLCHWIWITFGERDDSSYLKRSVLIMGW